MFESKQRFILCVLFGTNRIKVSGNVVYYKSPKSWQKRSNIKSTTPSQRVLKAAFASIKYSRTINSQGTYDEMKG